MAIDIRGGLQLLEDLGIYTIFLPFLLVFVLVYAILGRVNLFGQNSGKFNTIIALVIGILLVREGEASPLVAFINSYLPHVSAVIVVFLGFLIILGLFGVESNKFKGGLMVVFIVVSLGGGIWALTQATAQENVEFSIPWIGEFDLTEADAGALVVIGVFVLIVTVAIGYKPKKKGFEGFLDGMSKVGDAFGGNPPIR